MISRENQPNRMGADLMQWCQLETEVDTERMAFKIHPYVVCLQRTNIMLQEMNNSTCSSDVAMATST